jgi:hypothetical protein
MNQLASAERSYRPRGRTGKGAVGDADRGATGMGKVTERRDQSVVADGAALERCESVRAAELVADTNTTTLCNALCSVTLSRAFSNTSCDAAPAKCRVDTMHITTEANMDTTTKN